MWLLTATSAHVIQKIFTSFMGCVSVQRCISSTNKHPSDGNEPSTKPMAVTILRFSGAATEIGALVQLPSSELTVWLDFFRQLKAYLCILMRETKFTPDRYNPVMLSDWSSCQTCEICGCRCESIIVNSARFQCCRLVCGSVDENSLRIRLAWNTANFVEIWSQFFFCSLQIVTTVRELI